MGNSPDEIGTHAPIFICPDCKSQKLETMLFENPYDQYNPFNNQNKIGFGSRVWAYGYASYGIVLKIAAPKGYVKVTWPTDTGRYVSRYHCLSQIGWVKPGK